jgi:ABC-type antimicrobial peptide transport system permease subunit
LGAAIALSTGRFLTGFLFGVKPFDAVALVAAFVVLSAAALAATIVPARRAARVDPMIALRSD